jgi:deoxyribodipyrimidine photo-lyase
MSNRGRQNVASFLVEDLKLDWRLGAEWFESMLLDHDVCSNYGNWNYAAGIGNDPREDRKFNIIKQGLDYDPNGDFVKMWVPELEKLLEQASISKGSIHCPWKIKLPDLNKAGIKLGTSYPKPMIVAGEWDRHTNRLTNPKGGASNGHGQKRGMDFYFKPANKAR